MTNTLSRFSNRVENYVKYRPGYPAEMFSFLIKQKVLKNDSIIADIGSGTGISAKMFLDNGNVVFGVEPNKEMREAAEKLLGLNKNFKSVSGTAEASGLKAKCADIIIAAQAFHWFDADLFKKEMIRVLKPNGYFVLVWNDRLTDESEFLIEYENLLHNYSVDYKDVNHKNITNKEVRNYVLSAVDNKSFNEASFKNHQEFDYEGLKGRLLSSSYVPTEEQPMYNEMLTELKRIFDTFNKDGSIRFEYNTILYYGQLK
jgi:SAM-dependent methyltransferase